MMSIIMLKKMNKSQSSLRNKMEKGKIKMPDPNYWAFKFKTL